MTLSKDILNFLDNVAPISTKCEWDNCGLLVGDKDTEISKVLLCLDITNKVVDEAKKLGCELIISHHPVIFSGLKSIDSNSVVYNLIKNDISAICMHTNLDIAHNIGVNVCLANALGLSDITMYQEDFICIGKLSDTMTDKAFAEHVKESLKAQGVRYTNGKNIKRVAMCSGAGSEYIEMIEKYDFDAFVTGELKHHHFLFAKEKNICAVEAGHYNTEDVVITPLKELLSQNFSDVKFMKSEVLCDPVNIA